MLCFVKVLSFTVGHACHDFGSRLNRNLSRQALLPLLGLLLLAWILELLGLIFVHKCALRMHESVSICSQQQHTLCSHDGCGIRCLYF